jgi:hypothetical protein
MAISHSFAILGPSANSSLLSLLTRVAEFERPTPCRSGGDVAILRGSYPPLRAL